MEKVLIITKRTSGGVGTFLSQLLVMDGLQFLMATVETNNNRSIQIDTQYTFGKNNQLEKLRLYDPLSYLQFLGEIIWILKVVIKERPNIILTVDVHACLLGVFACLLSLTNPRIKLIATIHNNYPLVINEKIPGLLRGFLILACSIFFRRVDVFVCVSQKLATNFSQFFHIKKRVRVILNGLNITDKSNFNSIITQKELKILDKNFFLILSIGRFEPQKDYKTLIKAFSIFNAKIRSSRLILIGDGSQKSELKEIALKIEGKKNIYFLGRKDNTSLYLKRASIFVLSTHYEAFGYVLLEAMAEGIPVISTDVPYGPAEILGNGKYGILVKHNSEVDLTNAMLRLYEDEKLRIKFSRLGLERVKKYSQSAMVDSYERLIRK